MSKKRWFLRGLFPRVVADWEEVGARSIDKGRKKGQALLDGAMNQRRTGSFWNFK
jgi:hypothetical protein